MPTEPALPALAPAWPPLSLDPALLALVPPAPAAAAFPAEPEIEEPAPPALGEAPPALGDAPPTLGDAPPAFAIPAVSGEAPRSDFALLEHESANAAPSSDALTIGGKR
jgi:hypothetical protein